MRNSAGVVWSAMMLLAGTACGGSGLAEANPSGVCTNELAMEMSATRSTLRIGDTTTIRAQAMSCGGRELLSRTWRYSVADTAIAHIDSLSGLFTSRTAGSTAVLASGGDVIGSLTIVISP